MIYMKSVSGENYWNSLNFLVVILMDWIILSLRHLKSHAPYLWASLIMSVFFDFGDTLCC